MRVADGQYSSGEILTRGLSIDLEVGRSDNRIHQFAAVRCDNGRSFEYSGGNLQAALKGLDHFADGATCLIGHNLIEFDAAYLSAANPELQILQLPRIDTLRLNPIAFPRNPYHHLVKHYQDGGLKVHALKSSLDQDGYRSKARIDRYGRKTGDKPFARGALYKMLQNPIYRGEIVHKDRSYPGEHTAIVCAYLWDQVQQRLAENQIERKRVRPFANPSLLVGLLYDDAGLRMTPTHANKNGTRYRYYISQKLTTTARQDNPRGRRVPAGDIERLVEDRLTRFLADKSGLFGMLEPVVVDTAERMRCINAAGELANGWNQLEPALKRTWLGRLVHRIDLGIETLSVSIDLGRLLVTLDDSREPSALGTLDSTTPLPDIEPDHVFTLTIPARLKRAGMEMRLLIDGAGSGARTKSDRSLCRLLAQSHRFQSLLLQSRGKTMTEVAEEAGVTYPYFRRVLMVGFLAPDIAQAILRDRHPVELNAQQLSKHTNLPLSWDEQRSLLGLD